LQHSQLSLVVGATAQPKKMILTLQDDGVLRVYKSVDDAVGDVEALDAEETFRAVFDDSGETHGIHWIRPNEQGRFLRFIVANGEYTLVPQNKKDVPALLRLLRETKLIEPQDAEAQLKELERRLMA
jgi:hypothetical protein